MLMGSLRMLNRGIRMLFTLGMIALAVMFSGSAVGLRCILVMLGGLVVLVSSHFRLFSCLLPQRVIKPPAVGLFRRLHRSTEIALVRGPSLSLPAFLSGAGFCLS
jgi:hypothetical protein